MTTLRLGCLDAKHVDSYGIQKVHPLALATPWQVKAMWKGAPLKHDIHAVLVKVLMNGFLTDGVCALVVPFVNRLAV